MSFLIFFVLFILLVVVAWYRFANYEMNEVEGFGEGRLRVLSLKETENLIRNDADGYFSRLGPLDLAARGFDSLRAYMDASILDFVEFDDLDLLRQLRDDALKKVLRCEWINRERFLAMPWNIACTKGSVYEFGLPHTRGSVIVLPINSLDSNTLLHEQLHVYQKKYPEDFRKYLDTHGFKRWVYVDAENRGKIASNPDSDGWVYKNSEGELLCGTYITDNVERLKETGFSAIKYKPRNLPRYDHPCELAVYELLD